MDSKQGIFNVSAQFLHYSLGSLYPYPCVCFFLRSNRQLVLSTSDKRGKKTSPLPITENFFPKSLNEPCQVMLPPLNHRMPGADCLKIGFRNQLLTSKMRRPRQALSLCFRLIKIQLWNWKLFLLILLDSVEEGCVSKAKKKKKKKAHLERRKRKMHPGQPVNVFTIEWKGYTEPREW